MKLPGFPIPEPGETVASVVARHLHRTAGPKSRSLVILGLRGDAANSLVPSQLQTLADSMPAGHPWLAKPDEIVRHHTLVPLYSHFAHPNRSAALLATILAGATRNPAASLGLTVRAKQRLASSQKFCSDCVDHDVRTLGYTVGYREHQPSFVKVCVRHGKPLFLGCSQCQNQRKSLSAWRMAGRCGCGAPQSKAMSHATGDAAYEAGALFLARQAKTILVGSQPKISLAGQLRAALNDAGFAGRSGLNCDAIESALTARFGKLLLSDLGIPEAARTNSGSGWPSRMLNPTEINGGKIPDTLRCILLAGLVTDDIAELYAISSERNAPAKATPRGYSSLIPLQRPILSKQAILWARKASKGKITVAAALLHVKASQLAVDIRRQSLSWPLPCVTAKRLGPTLISEVTQALQSGFPKNEIQHSLGISEWSMQLIELASPELRELHRKAIIDRQRDGHRTSVLSHMQQHPSSSISEITVNCAGALDWLRCYDSEWLERHLPKLKRPSCKTRSARKDWQKFDLNCVAAIGLEVQRELNISGRPTRITISRLLRAANALNKPRDLVPLAIAEAKRRAETKDAYLQRRIKWALQVYADQHATVSMNRLRRVAGLPPERLLQYRELVQEVARRLQLTIDTRCALSTSWD